MNGINLDLTTVLAWILSGILALAWGAAYSRLILWVMNHHPKYLLLLLLPLSAIGVGVSLVLALPVIGLAGLVIVYIILAVAAAPVALIVTPRILEEMNKAESKDSDKLGFEE